MLPRTDVAGRSHTDAGALPSAEAGEPSRKGEAASSHPALFASAFDAAPEALLLLGADGRVIGANRAAKRLPFRLPPDAGRPFAALWPPEFGPDMTRWLAEAGAPERLEVAVSLPDGAVVLELSASAVPGGARVVAIRDTTERTRLGERALHAERLASIGRLAATLAHEIRNTLAGVDGALQVFQLDEGVPASRREILGEMRERIAHLREVVDDLLAYARPPRLSRHAWPVGEVLQAMRESASGHPEMEDVAVRGVNRCRPEDLVAVDAFQVRYVARNLVLNGAQAMGGRGEITIEARRRGTEILFRFADQGPGVRPEIAGRVFEPFFTTRPGGTGLGLSIAENVVAAHGGRLFLEPPHAAAAGGGTGACFVVALPVAGERSSGAPEGG